MYHPREKSSRPLSGNQCLMPALFAPQLTGGSYAGFSWYGVRRAAAHAWRVPRRHDVDLERRQWPGRTSQPHPRELGRRGFELGSVQAAHQARLDQAIVQVILLANNLLASERLGSELPLSEPPVSELP